VYYFYRIFIHQLSGLTSPDSLEICVGAAHSCVHLMEANFKRGLASPQTLLTIANAAIILLINMWRSKRLGLNVDISFEMADVVKCMGHLKRLEQRVQAAGRLWDTVLNVVYISDLTDAYNLAADAAANSYQTTQSTADIVPASSSTFNPVSFGQPSQFWDITSTQEYGSPAENGLGLNSPTSSTPNRYMESEVLPFDLSSVDITESQYVRAPFQASHTRMESTQQPMDWSPGHVTAATSDDINTLEGDWAEYMESIEDVLITLRRS